MRLEKAFSPVHASVVGVCGKPHFSCLERTESEQKGQPGAPSTFQTCAGKCNFLSVFGSEGPLSQNRTHCVSESGQLLVGLSRAEATRQPQCASEKSPKEHNWFNNCALKRRDWHVLSTVQAFQIQWESPVWPGVGRPEDAMLGGPPPCGPLPGHPAPQQVYPPFSLTDPHRPWECQ